MKSDMVAKRTGHTPGRQDPYQVGQENPNL
jgi:hypothetical protein